MKVKIEFFHSWYLFAVSFLGLLFLLISPYLLANLLLVAVLHYFYIKNGLLLARFRRNIFYAFIFSVLILGLNLLWPAKHVINPLESGLQISGKLFLLVLTSMASAGVINYTKVVLYLIIHKGLRVEWGYPILIAINSITLFKEEYERIQLNGKLRNLGVRGKVGVLFPLLVFAIRHSQRGSLSLVTRGLNPTKSFYFTYQLTPQDHIRLRLFLLFYILLVLMTLAFHFYFR